MLTILLCVTLLSSCVKFIYPLTEDKSQVVFKSELLGRWREKDATEYLIDSVDEKHYSVVMIDNGKRENRFSDSNFFLMTLTDINGDYFLDCYPDVHQPGFYQLGEQASNYMMPVHYILRLTGISKTTLEIESINTDEVKKLIEQKKFAVHYNSADKEEAFITSGSEELQKKLLELKKFPSAWDKEILKRF